MYTAQSECVMQQLTRRLFCPPFLQLSLSSRRLHRFTIDITCKRPLMLQETTDWSLRCGASAGLSQVVSGFYRIENNNPQLKHVISQWQRYDSPASPSPPCSAQPSTSRSRCCSRGWSWAGPAGREEEPDWQPQPTSTLNNTAAPDKRA